jgi:hypothetical protein
VFRERRLRIEERYTETHNATRKGASKYNGKVFRESRIWERREIYSETELYAERGSKINRKVSNNPGVKERRALY